MADRKLHPWDETPSQGEKLLPAHVYARERDWPGYFRALAHLPARDTLLRAIELFEQERPAESLHAVDVGCGDGRDVAELLRRGWRVTAIDGHPEAIERLLSRNDLVNADRLTTRLETFENLVIPKADLVNASFALPFCAPDRFGSLWNQIVGALSTGGRFAGQLFGNQDDWALLPDRTHHTPEQAQALLAGFEVEFWQEENRASRVDPAAHPKHWHVYHIVARKK